MDKVLNAGMHSVPPGLGDQRGAAMYSFVRKASLAGKDVNDWLVEDMGWEPALRILDATVFPWFDPNGSACEIGPGCGRFSRHLAERLQGGTLCLVDLSEWTRAFLERYFQGFPGVSAYASDGNSLAFLKESSQDLIFSGGTFIEFKLGHMLLYAREGARTLKLGGRFVFDFIDVDTSEGYEHLQRYSTVYPGCFSYHTGETVTRVFNDCGFSQETTWLDGKSTWTVLRLERKPYQQGLLRPGG